MKKNILMLVKLAIHYRPIHLTNPNKNEKKYTPYPVFFL